MCTCVASTGRYLPLVACLDGVLYVEPRGYQAAQHDVIRLSPDVAAIKAQQGYICCQPSDTSPASTKALTPVHYAVKVGDIRLLCFLLACMLWLAGFLELLSPFACCLRF